jgi:hypothetical protein
MPDNNTLEAQLLQRATSIGPDKPPVVGAPQVPQSTFENQQPDILSMIAHAGGLDDVSGGSPTAAGVPLVNTLAARAKDAIPQVAEEAQLTRWAPVQKLLEMLRGFNPAAEEAPEAAALRKLSQSNSTGFRVPDPTPILSPSPKVQIPQQIPTRDPGIAQRWADQVEADKRVASAPSKRTQMSGGARYYSGMGSKAVVNPEIVKAIRAMAETQPLAAVAAKYPNLNKETVRSIVKRDSWSWVK